ncbi:hypothetical protein MBLNU230_g6526t1 [Neophaeotheca triangularis]
MNEREKPPTTSQNKTSAKPKSTPQKLLHLLQTHWFLLALSLLILLASQVQVPPAQQNLKKTLTTYICVTLIFLLTGCTLDTHTLILNAARWRLHLFVQVQCFLLTSAITFGVAAAAGTNRNFMDPGLLVGLVFMGTVATTISSNVVMTRQAKGNTALTVVQTTLGNFLGVFLTPALVVMYLSAPGLWWTEVLPSTGAGEWEGIYRRVLFQLGLTIYVPLFVGQVLRWLAPGMVKRVCVDWKVGKLGSVALLVVLWQTYDQAFAVGAFEAVPGDNMVFVVFMSMGLFVVFFGVGLGLSLLWLPRRDVVAVCYCVPAKGIAMAVPISQGTFGGVSTELESKIQIPIVVYQGLQLVAGALLVPLFKKWIEKEEKRLAEENRGEEEIEVLRPASGDQPSTEEQVNANSKECA